MTESPSAPADETAPSPELRQALSTCYACDAVPQFACTKCGRLFCERHGGRRWVRDHQGIRRLVICDDCTPDQARMRRGVALRIAFFLSVLVFILAGALWTFVGFDLPVIDRPEPVPLDPPVLE